MSAKKVWISPKEFAEQQGMTPRAVNQHIKSGRIPNSATKPKKKGGKHKLVHRIKAAEELKGNTNQRLTKAGKKEAAKKSKTEAKKGSRRKSKKGDLTDEEKNRVIDESGVVRCVSLNEAQKLVQEYNAALKKLEFEKQQGRLIAAEIVEKEAFKAGRLIREQCMAIVDKCSPLVAAEADQFECKQILLAEINFILDGLSTALEVKI